MDEVQVALDMANYERELEHYRKELDEFKAYLCVCRNFLRRVMDQWSTPEGDAFVQATQKLWEHYNG